MNEVIDSCAFSNFCRINLPNEVPDGDTIGRFRNILNRGYKAHIGVDRESGLVHHVKVTSANEHDVTVTSELLHGEENTVNGDSGYIGAQKRPEAIKKNKSSKKIKYIINRRPSSIKKLSKSGQYAALYLADRKNPAV